MLNILIADGMEKSSLEVLEKMNFNVVDHHYDKNDLMVEIKKYNIIVVRSATKITKDIIDEAVKDSNLKLIIRAGVGLDNIDVDYAKENGIIVRNTPNVTENGWIGPDHPNTATVEWGNEMLQTTADYIVDLIEELKTIKL